MYYSSSDLFASGLIFVISGIVSLIILVWFIITMNRIAKSLQGIDAKASRVLEHLEYMTNSSVFDEDSKTP